MAMQAAEDATVDDTFDEMAGIALGEIIAELAVYEEEEERQRKAAALDDALDDAFESEDEKDEANWEEVEMKDEVVDEETGEVVEVVRMEKRRKVKEKRMSAMDMAIMRRKQIDLVERGLADPST
jgi:hypothetical protein